MMIKSCHHKFHYQVVVSLISYALQDVKSVPNHAQDNKDQYLLYLRKKQVTIQFLTSYKNVNSYKS